MFSNRWLSTIRVCVSLLGLWVSKSLTFRGFYLIAAKILFFLIIYSLHHGLFLSLFLAPSLSTSTYKKHHYGWIFKSQQQHKGWLKVSLRTSKRVRQEHTGALVVCFLLLSISPPLNPPPPPHTHISTPVKERVESE